MHTYIHTYMYTVKHDDSLKTTKRVFSLLHLQVKLFQEQFKNLPANYLILCLFPFV